MTSLSKNNNVTPRVITRINITRIVSSLVFIIILSGCQTMGGMPSKQVDLILKKTIKNTTTCTTACNSYEPLELVIGNYDDSKRNKWIDLNLIRVNSAYDLFVRGLQNSKTSWSIGTAIADLAFNVASSLTPSAGVKANYAAASAMLTGSHNIINKEAFHEKTVSALVAAMDARRAKAIVIIRKGMVKSITLYPISAAHEDILAYQRASSLAGGLSFIESESQNEIKSSENELDGIFDVVKLSKNDIKKMSCISNYLDNITKGKIKNEILQEIYNNIFPVKTSKIENELIQQFKQGFIDSKSNNAERIYKYFKDKDLITDEGCKEYE